MRENKTPGSPPTRGKREKKRKRRKKNRAFAPCLFEGGKRVSLGFRRVLREKEKRGSCVGIRGKNGRTGESPGKLKNQSHVSPRLSGPQKKKEKEREKEVDKCGSYGRENEKQKKKEERLWKQEKIQKVLRENKTPGSLRRGEKREKKKKEKKE